MPDQRRWFTFWAVGGIPILASCVQALSALFGVEFYRLPVVGVLSASLQSMAVFAEMADILLENPALIPLLFVAVFLAWVLQGAAMWKNWNREIVYGGAVAASAFFLLLFLGVYWPVTPWGGADVPLIQRFLPVTLAVGASLAVLASARLYPRNRELGEYLSDELATARRTAERQRDRVERELPDDALELLAEYAPEAVETIRSDRETFVEECETVLRAVEELREDANPVESDLGAAQDLSARAEALDAAKTVERAEQQLQTAVASTARETFDGDSRFVSRFDVPYDLNLPQRLRTIDIGPWGVQTTVARVGEDTESYCRSEEPDVRTLVDGLVIVESHFEEVAEVLDRHEQSFVDGREAVESNLSRAKAKVERLGDHLQRGLKEVLFDGTVDVPETEGENLHTREEIEDDLSEARTELHDCQFERATALLDRARTMSHDFDQTLEFFSALDGRAAGLGEDGGPGEMRYPPPAEFEYRFINDALLEHLRSDIVADYGVDYAVHDDRSMLVFEPVDEETDGDIKEVEDATDEDDERVANREAVGYLLSRLNALEDRDDYGTIDVELDPVPENCRDETAITRFESFLQSRGYVEFVSVSRTGPKIAVELRTIERKPIGGRLLDDYESWSPDPPFK